MNTNRNPIQIHISSALDVVDGVTSSLHYADITVSYVGEGLAGRIIFDNPIELRELYKAVHQTIETDDGYCSPNIQIWKEDLRTEGFYYAIDAGDSSLAINTLHDMEVLRDALRNFIYPNPK